MRKWLILFICLIAGTAFAGQLRVLNPFISTAVVCSTTNDSKIWNPTDQTDNTSSTTAWRAQKITLAATTTVTMYRIEECDNGGDAGSNDVLIMNHDSVNDYPDETSVVANSTASLNASSIDSCVSYNEHDYELGSTIELSAGTYWIVHEEDSSDIRLWYDSSSTGDRLCYSSNSGSSWSCLDDYSYDMELWGCQ